MKYLYTFFWPAILAIPVNVISFDFFETYIYSDWHYLRILVVLIVVDTIMSWAYHIKNKSFSSKGFSQMFVKVLCYAAVLVVANAAKNINTDVQIDNSGAWVSSLICWALYIREALSILEKAEKLKNGIVPSKIMKYFKDFNEDKEDGNNKETTP